MEAIPTIPILPVLSVYLMSDDATQELDPLLNSLPSQMQGVTATVFPDLRDLV